MAYVRFVGIAALLVAGCGPAVGVEETEGDASSSSTQSATSSSMPSPTTAGPPGVTGDVTTSVPTTGAESSTGGEVGVDDLTATAFITDPDGGGIHDPCDIHTQDCGTGEACRPFSIDGGPQWNSARCSPIPARPDPVGASCVIEDSPVSGIDSCAQGAMCFNVDENSLAGTCVEFCTDVCQDPDDTCVVGNDGFISVCLPGCDPLLQGCPTDETCVGSHGTVDFFCMRPDTPYVDGAQVMPAACGPGRVAVPPALVDGCEEDTPCCTDFCDLQVAMPECPAGLQCEPWEVEGTSPGVQYVGACVSPR